MNTHMRRKISTAVLLLMFLSPMVAQAMPNAEAVTPGATITLDPTRGAPGTIVTITSTTAAFTAGATVTMRFNTLNQWAWDPYLPYSHQASISITLPAGVREFPTGTTFTFPTVWLTPPTGYPLPRTIYVVASDDGGTTSTSAAFYLTEINPTLDPFGDRVPREAFTITGSGWTPGTVTIYLSYVGGATIGSGTADSLGSLTGTVTLPDLKAGPYTVFGKDTAGFTDDTTVNVQSAVTFTVTSLRRIVGATFGLTGRGFTYPITIPANTITVDGAATTHAATTVSTDGTVSIPTITLAITPYTSGLQTVIISGFVGPYPTPYPTLLVSDPNLTGEFSVSNSPTSGVVGASLTVHIYNYPANLALDVKLGGISLGSITTDANGAATRTFTIPSTPGKATGYAYTLDAVSPATGVVANHPGTFTLYSSVVLYKVAEKPLPTDKPSLSKGDKFIVSVRGYWPYDYITFSLSPAEFTVLEPLTEYWTHATGKADITFTVQTLPAHTHTTLTVTATGAVAGAASITTQALQPPTITITAPASGLAGATASLTISNVIGSTYYQIRFAGTVVRSVVSPAPAVPVSFSTTFTVPSVAYGPHTVDIAYYGTITPLATATYVVSAPLTSPGASFSATTAYPGQGLQIRLWGFGAGELVQFRLGGLPLYSIVVDANGAAAHTYDWTGRYMPSGVYATSFTGLTSGISRAGPIFTVVPSPLWLSPTSGPVHTTVTGTIHGLEPNTAHLIAWDGTPLHHYVALSDTAGSVTIPFIVPTATPGDHTVAIVKATAPTVAIKTSVFTVTAPFIVVGSSAKFIPLQQVRIKYKPAVTWTPPVFASIALDGYPIETGWSVARYDGAWVYASFIMPNGEPGILLLTVWMWDNVTHSFVGSLAIERVSGAGALLIGVETAADIAYIKTKVDTITIKLSDLDAKIVAIKDDVAVIDTKLGTMTATLSAINATLTQLIVGTKGDILAKIDTAVGTITAKFSDLDAKITKVSGDLVTISTKIGDVTTTLGDIKAKVVAIDGSVATINTDVGVIKGTVSKIDGTTATIKTDAGDMKVKLDELSRVTVGVPLFIYVITALSLIAAIFAIIAVVMIHRRMPA